MSNICRGNIDFYLLANHNENLITLILDFYLYKINQLLKSLLFCGMIEILVISGYNSDYNRIICFDEIQI